MAELPGSHEPTLDTLQGDFTLTARMLFPDCAAFESPGDVAGTPLASAGGPFTAMRVFISAPGEFAVREVTKDVVIEQDSGIVTMTFPYDTTGYLILGVGLS